MNRNETLCKEEMAPTAALPARPVVEEPPKKPQKNLAMHLLAGGVAGCCEAVACHPLDTIKVNQATNLLIRLDCSYVVKDR